MTRVKKRRKPPGAAPGALVLTGDAVPPRVHAFRYSADSIEESSPASARECRRLAEKPGVTWIDVQGLADLELLRTLGEEFGLHPLALEDVVSLRQRPKADDYDTHLFIIARMPDARGGLKTEQTSIFLGPNYVITFQEQHGDCLEPVRDRLRKGKGSMRRSGADYLAYAIIDSIVDAYFPLLESYGEHLERMEDLVVEHPSRAWLEKIYDAKRDLLTLRRAVWPTRDAVNSLLRDETDLITEPTRLYLRDCYDHSVQILDMVETFRELAAGLVDIYMSSLSQKLNEVMKVLTIIATIFIPLTFIVGIYGMNVPLPGQETPASFDIIMWGMAGLALLMLWYFHRRGWIGSGEEPPVHDPHEAKHGAKDGPPPAP